MVNPPRRSLFKPILITFLGIIFILMFLIIPIAVLMIVFYEQKSSESSPEQMERIIDEFIINIRWTWNHINGVFAIFFSGIVFCYKGLSVDYYTIEGLSTVCQLGVMLVGSFITAIPWKLTNDFNEAVKTVEFVCWATSTLCTSFKKFNKTKRYLDDKRFKRVLTYWRFIFLLMVIVVTVIAVFFNWRIDGIVAVVNMIAVILNRAKPSSPKIIVKEFFKIIFANRANFAVALSAFYETFIGYKLESKIVEMLTTWRSFFALIAYAFDIY